MPLQVRQGISVGGGCCWGREMLVLCFKGFKRLAGRVASNRCCVYSHLTVAQRPCLPPPGARVAPRADSPSNCSFVSTLTMSARVNGTHATLMMKVRREAMGSDSSSCRSASPPSLFVVGHAGEA